MFSEELKKVMQTLGINQAKVSALTGKSKGSVSQYITGKQIPTEDAQRDIAVSLGLEPDYFLAKQPTQPRIMRKRCSEHIQRLRPEEAAEIMGVHPSTIHKGLQQGVFPWGYGIHTSENRWVYFINAKRFAEIEGVSV